MALGVLVLAVTLIIPVVTVGQSSVAGAGAVVVVLPTCLATVQLVALAVTVMAVTEILAHLVILAAAQALVVIVAIMELAVMALQVAQV